MVLIPIILTVASIHIEWSIMPDLSSIAEYSASSFGQIFMKQIFFAA